MDLTTITVADFKARFYRDFQYKTVDDKAIQFVGDPDFVQDQDIANAFADAMTLINQGIFSGNNNQITIAYLYLTAHCLCLNIRAADGGINGSNTAGFNVAGRGVGSVNESYQIPEAYADDPLLAEYAQTPYGQKYLTMALPFLRGNVTGLFGGAHPGR